MTHDIRVSHPIVTIGVPFYNEGRFLEATLASLQAQTFGDFAVLMTDNCSTDDSAAIAARFAETDPRFILVRQTENIGALANFAFALQASASPFFLWLGGHDLLAPSFLQKHVAALRADPGLTLSYSFAKIIDSAGADLSFIGDPRLSRMRAVPALRYLQVPRYGHSYLVNNLFRRDAISDFDFAFSPIWDAVLLSHAIYKGGFYCIEEPLYWQRDMHPPGSESPENLALRVGGAASATDGGVIAKSYLRDFSTIGARDPVRMLLMPVLRLLLGARYDAEPTRAVRGIRRVLRIKNWLSLGLCAGASGRDEDGRV